MSHPSAGPLGGLKKKNKLPPSCWSVNLWYPAVTLTTTEVARTTRKRKSHASYHTRYEPPHPATLTENVTPIWPLRPISNDACISGQGGVYTIRACAMNTEYPSYNCYEYRYSSLYEYQYVRIEFAKTGHIIPTDQQTKTDHRATKICLRVTSKHGTRVLGAAGRLFLFFSFFFFLFWFSIIHRRFDYYSYCGGASLPTTINGRKVVFSPFNSLLPSSWGSGSKAGSPLPSPLRFVPWQAFFYR